VTQGSYILQAGDFDAVLLAHSAVIKDHGYVTYSIEQMSNYEVSWDETHYTSIYDSTGL
jgi:hypothetical protein